MKKIILFLFIFLTVGALQAAAQEWKIDYAHTNFYFEVNHTYVPVRGQFTKFSGEVFFDPNDPAKSKFDFVINVDSVDTKIGKRDTHLRSPDFFDAAKFPLITFKTSKVIPVGHNKYDVNGVLTIKDVSKKTVLEFEYHGQKDNPIKPGEVVAGLETKLVLDRLEYNVGDGKFYKLGVVDKDVNILFVIELMREK